MNRCIIEINNILNLPDEIKQKYPKLYLMGLTDWVVESLLIWSEEQK